MKVKMRLRAAFKRKGSKQSYGPSPVSPSQSTAAMPGSPSSTFDNLPSEILLAIRNEIHDLESLVSFTQTCRKAYALADEAYWGSAINSAGFAVPVQKQGKVSSRAVASAIVHCASTLPVKRNDPEAGYLLRKLITEESIFSTDSYSDLSEGLDGLRLSGTPQSTPDVEQEQTMQLPPFRWFHPKTLYINGTDGLPIHIARRPSLGLQRLGNRRIARLFLRNVGGDLSKLYIIENPDGITLIETLLAIALQCPRYTAGRSMGLTIGVAFSSRHVSTAEMHMPIRIQLQTLRHCYDAHDLGWHDVLEWRTTTGSVGPQGGLGTMNAIAM